MINAWATTLKERHGDNKVWVCLVADDAVQIAKNLTSRWLAHYSAREEQLETQLYGDCIYYCYLDDAFSVSVGPTKIRESGENLVLE